MNTVVYQQMRGTISKSTTVVALKLSARTYYHSLAINNDMTTFT